MVGKICASGRKVTFVPVRSVVPIGGERRLGYAALVALAPDLAVALDLELEPLGERVHHRDADAVQAARDLVAVLVELPARVQRGHHDLGGGALLAGVLVDRDAAAVVHDGDAVVVVDDDVDLGAVAGERLVDRVVDDLVDEVVQPIGTGRPDVHRGPLADRLEAFEDLDGTRVVATKLLPCGPTGAEPTCAAEHGWQSVPRRSLRGRGVGGRAVLAANHPSWSRVAKGATQFGKPARKLVDRGACVKAGAAMFSRITPRA